LKLAIPTESAVGIPKVGRFASPSVIDPGLGRGAHRRLHPKLRRAAGQRLHPDQL